MITPIANAIGTRRRVAIVASAVLLVGAGAAIAATAATSGGTAKPSRPYQDYLGGQGGQGGQGGADQCSLPVAQRQGGWFCPAASGPK